MRKHLLNLVVKSNEKLSSNYILIKLTHYDSLPECKPGQFVEIKVEDSAKTYLRRPISIHFVDKDCNELWLLIQLVGEGTRKLATLKVGDLLNVMMPLGNGFSDIDNEKEVLLVGGGVGIAPLLLLGKKIKDKGLTPKFLLGARTAKDLLQTEEFEKFGNVYRTTEDGSAGKKGFVTNHSILNKIKFDKIFTCGPTPMMKAVAKYAHDNNIECEVSLENTMACGIGACLCCVTDTKEGHKCVCSEGPVFNINDLKWQN